MNVDIDERVMTADEWRWIHKGTTGTFETRLAEWVVNHPEIPAEQRGEMAANQIIVDLVRSGVSL
jgi:hypothetical protein